MVTNRVGSYALSCMDFHSCACVSFGVAEGGFTGRVALMELCIFGGGGVLTLIVGE